MRVLPEDRGDFISADDRFADPVDQSGQRGERVVLSSLHGARLPRTSRALMAELFMNNNAAPFGLPPGFTAHEQAWDKCSRCSVQLVFDAVVVVITTIIIGGGGGFFLACEDLGRMFNNSFLARALLFLFLRRD